MKLHNITAENFLSLCHCRINKLDPHLNFIVGPNGSGKTSVFRLLRMIRDVWEGTLSGKRPTLETFCTRRVFPPTLDACISVEFDTSWEQELICAFLCTAFSQPEVLNTVLSRLQSQTQAQLPSEEYLFFTNWLLRNIRPETIPFFFRGDLRVTYRKDMYEYLRLSYTFLCRGEPVTILMGPRTGTGGTFWKGTPSEIVPSGPAIGDSLITFLWTPRRHKGPEEGGPLLEFFHAQPHVEPALLDTEDLFLFIADQGSFLQVNAATPQYVSLPTYTTLSQASGIDFSQAGGRSLSFSGLLALLIKQACVFTNNVRSPFSLPLTLKEEDMFSQHLNLDDEQHIPLLLFRLKNGDPPEQARFRNIQKTFSLLMGGDLTFDISTKLLLQQPSNPLSASLPTLDIRVMDTEGDTSLAYQGAGVWEALVLATLLNESEGRLILLDEPAANLHPGMQHKLLEVLRDSSGQAIIVTHSAHLLPNRADEFHHVYRMQKNYGETRVLDLGKTFSSHEDKLENELRASRDLAALLFANGVILVEGATEIGAFNEWFNESSASKGKTFADLNVILHAVGGKPEFPFYLRFLTAFGVPWSVICDGDALPPNKDKNNLLWKVLKELHLIADVPKDSTFETLKANAAQSGVYTYDTPYAATFESIPEVKNYLATHQTPGGKTAYKGRYIAQHLHCPHTVNELLQQALKQLLV